MAANLALKHSQAFSLARPPGHHSGKESIEGFCYLNNLAIAVTKLQTSGRVGETAILDIDAHHGNGTQDIFMGNKHVQYYSIHQSPLYPGSGLISENNCHNYPVKPGTAKQKYVNILKIIINDIKKSTAKFLAVSLGFDTCISDPLTQLNLKPEDYSEIGRLIRSLNLPTLYVYEGGYGPDLAGCTRQFFNLH